MGILCMNVCLFPDSIHCPFCIRFSPILEGKGLEQEELAQRLLQDVPPCHIFMDSWFPSKGKWYFILLWMWLTFIVESIEWMDAAHQNYTVTVNKKRWSHLWSVLRSNTEIGEVGMAYHENSGKVSIQLQFVLLLTICFSLQCWEEDTENIEPLVKGIKSYPVTKRCQRNLSL